MPTVARSFRGGDISRAEASGHRLCPGKAWALCGTQLARFLCLMCLPAPPSSKSQPNMLKGPGLRNSQAVSTVVRNECFYCHGLGSVPSLDLGSQILHSAAGDWGEEGPGLPFLLDTWGSLWTGLVLKDEDS